MRTNESWATTRESLRDSAWNRAFAQSWVYVTSLVWNQVQEQVEAAVRERGCNRVRVEVWSQMQEETDA